MGNSNPYWDDWGYVILWVEFRSSKIQMHTSCFIKVGAIAKYGVPILLSFKKESIKPSSTQEM
jgi:hypothetical protein